VTVISGDFAGATPALVEGVQRPTVNALKLWLSIESTSSEVTPLLQDAVAVATERVLSRCVPFVDDVGNPTDLVPQVIYQAILMQSARWYRRRNSVSGVEGYADIGLFRLSSLDPDIEQLVERWLGHDFA